MKLLKFLFRVIFGILRYTWLAITFVITGILFVYVFPAAVIASIVYGINTLINKIIVWTGKPVRKKYKPQDTVNEPIEEISAEDLFKQEGASVT